VSNRKIKELKAQARGAISKPAIVSFKNGGACLGKERIFLPSDNEWGGGICLSSKVTTERIKYSNVREDMTAQIPEPG